MDRFDMHLIHTFAIPPIVQERSTRVVKCTHCELLAREPFVNEHPYSCTKTMISMCASTTVISSTGSSVDGH